MSTLFDHTANDPKFYFSKFFYRFEKVESIEEWYQLLDLLVDHLKTTDIPAIFVLGMILHAVSKREIHCVKIRHARQLDIHKFWQHVCREEVFQNVLEEYFRLAELEMQKYSRGGSSSIYFEDVIKRYPEDPTELNEIKAVSKIRFDYNYYISCSEVESNSFINFTGTFLVFVCYNMKQFIRFKESYTATFKRFLTTKAASQSDY